MSLTTLQPNVIRRHDGSAQGHRTKSDRRPTAFTAQTACIALSGKLNWHLRFLVLLALSITGCGRPAQIGSSDEVLSAVDALYTAVASRRIELLEKSAARIEELHTSGELPDAAHRTLKALIEEARSGKWETSVRKLHEFIRGQRRTPG